MFRVLRLWKVCRSLNAPVCQSYSAGNIKYSVVRPIAYIIIICLRNGNNVSRGPANLEISMQFLNPTQHDFMEEKYIVETTLFLNNFSLFFTLIEQNIKFNCFVKFSEGNLLLLLIRVEKVPCGSEENEKDQMLATFLCINFFFLLLQAAQRQIRAIVYKSNAFQQRRRMSQHSLSSTLQNWRNPEEQQASFSAFWREGSLTLFFYFWFSLSMKGNLLS